MNIKYLCVVALLAIGCKANVQESVTAASAPGGGGINGHKETAGEGRPTNNEQAQGPTFSQCAEAGLTKAKEVGTEAYDYAAPHVKEWTAEAKKAYDDWQNKPDDKKSDEKKTDESSEP